MVPKGSGAMNVGTAIGVYMGGFNPLHLRTSKHFGGWGSN